MKYCAWPPGVEKRSQCQATIDVRAYDNGWISAHYGPLDKSGKLVCITPTFPGNMGGGGCQCWRDQPLDLRMEGSRFGSPISTNFDDRNSKPVFNEHIGLRYQVCVSPCRHTCSDQDIEAFRIVIRHVLCQRRSSFVLRRVTVEEALAFSHRDLLSPHRNQVGETQSYNPCRANERLFWEHAPRSGGAAHENRVALRRPATLGAARG